MIRSVQPSDRSNSAESATVNVLVLYSRTGGGHRSAGQALAEALVADSGRHVTVKMVDALADMSRFPLNRFPAWYPAMLRVPRLWEEGFRATNGTHRARVISRLARPFVGPRLRELVRHMAPDIIVSVHPLLTRSVLAALDPHRSPFVVVVTDLVSAHALWFDAGVDLCVVPTDAAGQLAIHHGIPLDRIFVAGLPVSASFGEQTDVAALRAKLGWPVDRPTVLLTGGGDGIGPVVSIAHAIASAGLNCHLAVVSGRNRALFQKLRKHSWQIPTTIYGFAYNMPVLMRASDVLVSKAGPGTISEALAAGLPIVLYGYLPGQEMANVGYLVNAGAGVWGPGPQRVVQALQKLLVEPDGEALLIELAGNAKRLGRPDSAKVIAREIIKQALIGREPLSAA